MQKRAGIDPKAMGQRIREERERFGLSREELADLLGLSDYYVGQLERGERQMSLPVLVKVARCLHLSLDYLVWGKRSGDASYIRDALQDYEAAVLPGVREIHELLAKCSAEELELIKKLVKTLLPYMGKKG